MIHILAFFQRLTSPVGETNVKAAWAELVLIIGSVTGLIASFKTKDWSAIFQQGDQFYIALGLLVVAVRNILSSNDTAIKDANLPKVTGTVNLN